METFTNLHKTEALPAAGEGGEEQKQREGIVSEAVKKKIMEFERTTQSLLLSNYNGTKSGEVLIKQEEKENGLTEKEQLKKDLETYIKEYKVQIFPANEIPKEIQTDIKDLKPGAAHCEWRELRDVIDENGENLHKKLGGLNGMADGGFRVFYKDSTGGVSVVDIMSVCSKSFQRWQRRTAQAHDSTGITVETALKQLLKEVFKFDPDAIPYTTISKITKIINTVLDDIKQKEQVETADGKEIDKDKEFDF